MRSLFAVIVAAVVVGLAVWLTRIGYEATHAGLALAISIAALVNALLLYRGLLRDGVIAKAAAWLKLLPKIVIASSLMALSIVQIQQTLDWWLEASILLRSGWLALCIGVGALSYFVALLLLGVRPVQFTLKHFPNQT